MLTQTTSGLLLQVKVVPNSSRTQIAGTLGKPPQQRLKIKVAQPPEDNRANQAVIQLLADVLGLNVSQISLTAGHTRPQKTLRLSGITHELASARLFG